MTAKLYQSRDWLVMQHHLKHKSLEEMAQMCGVKPLTIRRAMEKFDLRIIK